MSGGFIYAKGEPIFDHIHKRAWRLAENTPAFALGESPVVDAARYLSFILSYLFVPNITITHATP